MSKPRFETPDSPPDWADVKRLFEGCLDRPLPERAAFLDRQCAADSALRAEVEKLLAADTSEATDIDTGPPVEMLSAIAVGDVRGGRIGPYEIRRVIGSGGMGTVYEAVQERPGRIVAVKTLRIGLQQAAVRQRFDYESRILARLQHPGIAQVYDAGTYRDPTSGLEIPYFAMEFVEGARPFDDYVRAAGPGLDAVLTLFVTVCEAVHYGHQQGFIHRDLKPANVLVDRDGRAKIIDFGIARTTGDETTGLAMQTEAGELLGTLKYMSPEQLDLDGDKLDNRVDVFALGVMLYELLAGQPPYDLRGKPIATAAEIIRDAELPPPSRRGRTSVELDWIVSRAMAKERERRYASAGELAADIRRFLRHEPVLAGAPSPVYRARKFVRRHRFVVTSVASVLLAAVAVMLFESAQRSSERRREAVAALDAAKSRVREVRRLRESVSELEQRVATAMQQVERMYLEPAERENLHSRQDEVSAARRRSEALSHEVLELLRRAERLDPSIAGTDDVRLELYVEKWRAAEALRHGTQNDWVRTRAEATSDFYRKLVENADEGGRYRAELFGAGAVRISSFPAGAAIYVFRYRNQSELFDGGEARLVPHPVGVDPRELPVRPGTWGLRIVRAAGELRVHDTIFEMAGHRIEGTMFVRDRSGRVARLAAIDGAEVRDEWTMREALAGGRDALRRFALEVDGRREEVAAAGLGEAGLTPWTPRALAEVGEVPARVFTDGAFVDVLLPSGLGVRTTAAPLLPVRECQVGTTAVERLPLERGSYLALLQLDGREDRRIPFKVGDGVTRFAVELLPLGTTPEGFCHVQVSRQQDPQAWIMEREVTCAEYLQFLNAVETRREIADSPRPIRFPRFPVNESKGGYWPRNRDGRFALPPDWDPRWPVTGVSWHDAHAYAAWLTDQAAARGEPFRFTLTTRGWWQAASFHLGTYVFGDRFLPQWAKSCFSRPRPCQEPVMSYPVDETPWGLFDFAGGAFEWVDGWFWEEKREQSLMGGSWAYSERAKFRSNAVLGQPADAANITFGFRLSAHRTDR